VETVHVVTMAAEAVGVVNHKSDTTTFRLNRNGESWKRGSPFAFPKKDIVLP
jgi:hypothetical protein